MAKRKKEMVEPVIVDHDGVISNVHQMPRAFYKGKSAFTAVIVLSAIGITVLTAFGYKAFEESRTYYLAYSCAGVKEEWLNDHPFDASSFPTSLKRGEKLILNAPKIENYTFLCWQIAWEGNTSSNANKEFKDGEAYRASDYYVSFSCDKATITAIYLKNLLETA